MAESSKKAVAASAFALEYVTSSVPVLANDGVVVNVVNDSAAPEDVHVVIYQNTGTGAVIVADTGGVSVGATWTWSLGFTVKNPGDYWVRIQATSESLIPKAGFQRAAGATWTSLVDYKPGDFAVFSLTRKRLW